MADLGPVLAALAVAIIGAIGTTYSARRLRRLGIGDDQATLKAGLREVADLWEEKYNLEHAALIAEQLAHAETKASRTLERELAAQCRSDLDDARSKVRMLERRRGPRA